MFDDIDVDTLARWHGEALAAFHDLQTGKSAVDLTHNGKRVVYQRANFDKLRGYISQLAAAIAGKSSRRSAIGITF
jgi:hypothetical protein